MEIILWGFHRDFHETYVSQVTLKPWLLFWDAWLADRVISEPLMELVTKLYLVIEHVFLYDAGSLS